MIFVKYCRRKNCEKPLAADMHLALQICTVLAGVVEIRCPFRNFSRTMTAGDMFFSSCWEAHATYIHRDFSVLLTAIISIDTFGEISNFNELDFLAPFLVEPNSRPAIKTRSERLDIIRLGRQIASLNRNRPFGYKTLQWLKIHELMITAQRNWPQRCGDYTSNISLILPAINLLNRNNEEIISIKHAATECKMGRSVFCDTFHKVFGTSFGRYALQARMSQAAYFIRNSNLSIKDIALKNGFSNNSNFHHAFKNYFGSTPVQFREISLRDSGHKP